MDIEKHKYFRLIVILIAGFGVFLTAFDFLVANIALPNIQQYFNVSTNQASWVLTIYTLSLSATIILFGRLSDKFGHLNLFRIGIIVFAISSLCSGFAYNINILIFFRALQGVGAAMIQATAMALITVLLPKKEHGKAMATFAIFYGIGNVLGASIGGVVVSFFHWSYIFWINIPLCIIILLASTKLKQNLVSIKKSLDLKGILVYAIMAFLLILGIKNFSNLNQILSSIFYLSLSIFFLIVLIYIEKKQKFPAVNFDIFFNKKSFPLSLGILTSGYIVSTVYISSPIILHYLFIMSPWKIGLIALISPIFVIISANFFKKLIHKFSNKTFQIIGLLFMGFASLGLYFATYHENIAFFCVLLAFFGIGNGLYIPTSLHAYMKQANLEWQGSASALSRMLNALGMSLGASISTAIIQICQSYKGEEPEYGYLMIWLFGFTITMVGASLLHIFYNTKEEPENIINPRILSQR